MKQEDVDKIELAKELLKYTEPSSDKEIEKEFEIVYDLIDVLCGTKDLEILNELLDLVSEESDKRSGFSQYLKTRIMATFPPDQIIRSLSRKFDSLAERSMRICAEMSAWLFYNGYYEQFRKIFNEIKSRNSEGFLKCLREWIDPDYEKDLSLLESDMNEWEQ